MAALVFQGLVGRDKGNTIEYSINAVNPFLSGGRMSSYNVSMVSPNLLHCFVGNFAESYVY